MSVDLSTIHPDRATALRLIADQRAALHHFLARHPAVWPVPAGLGRLNDATILAIRQQFAAGKRIETIAAVFGVSRPLIIAIVAGGAQ